MPLARIIINYQALQLVIDYWHSLKGEIKIGLDSVVVIDQVGILSWTRDIAQAMLGLLTNLARE